VTYEIGKRLVSSPVTAGAGAGREKAGDASTL